MQHLFCKNDQCRKPVPPGRRKYCCVECGNIVNLRRSAERSLTLRAEAYSDRMGKYAPRTCLSCGSSFMSGGPWNRICHGCTESNQYQTERAVHISGHVNRTARDRMA